MTKKIVRLQIGIVFFFSSISPLASQEAWVLPENQIAPRHQAQAGEALGLVPGAFEENYGLLESPTFLTLRGASSRETLTLFEGVPINSPVTGQADLSTVPLESLGSAESLGRGGSFEGWPGGGGALTLDAGKPTGLITAGLDGAYGAYQTLGSQFNQGVNIDTMAYNLAGNRWTQTGWRPNAGAGRSAFGAFAGYDLTSDQHLEAVYGHFDGTRGVPGPGGDGTAATPGLTRQDLWDRTRLTYQANLLDGWSAQVRGFWDNGR